jgi:chromosome segregation ATPase
MQAARLARLARTARGDQGSERARRRALIHRFMQRVREREDELRRVSAQLESHVHEQRAASTSAGEHRVELERELRLVAAQRDRRRAQAGRFLQRAQARDTELARCDEEVARLSQSLRAQVDEQRAALGAAAEREVALERALAGLASDFDRRHGQARRFARRALGLAEAVESLKSDVERVSADVHGCDAEIERLRRENARRRAQAARFAVRMRVRPSDPFVELVQVDEVDEPALPASHLIFVHTGGGYSLVERDGPPPARHTPLELPDLHDGPLVVSALRRSPLPGDARPCVVAERS